MAKLRDTAIKDNLAIAGNVTAAGKVLSVEGHTHTPANITGLDKYIEDKVKASGTTLPENINAKTLDGHAASDFVLKSEQSTNGTYTYFTTIGATSLKFVLSNKFMQSQYLIQIESSDFILEFDTIEERKRIIYKKPTLKMPTWDTELSGSILYIYSISDVKTKLSIRVTTNIMMQQEDLIVTESPINNTAYIFISDIRSAINLGYNIFNNTIDKDTSLNIIKPKKLLSANENILIISAIQKNKIIDLDNNVIIMTTSTSIIQTKEKENITIKTIDSANRKKYLIKGLSDNLIIAYEYHMPFYIDIDPISDNVSPIISNNESLVYPQLTFNSIRNNLESNSISATINGVQFDGKTNITTPATKLITPVHINGIEFDGSQDITIPAPTNALTLGGLDSSQYIKATDVGNAAGKIPRFDNDGFLVYPDGSKERIENG